MACCKNGCIPVRAVVGLMICSACFISYMVRVNLSINIIAMVDSSSKSSEDSLAECLLISNDTKTITNSSDGSFSKLTALPDYGIRYDWDSKIQGLMLGSYFWGYVLTSIPGGLLAERFGPKLTVGVTGFISAAVTLLTPLAASCHYSAVICLRFILGLVGGVVYPSLHCLVSRWAPPTEKGKFTGALMGGTLGTLVTWPLLGVVVEAWGWKWGFFLPGAITLIWCCLWMIFISDSPETHPHINEDEKMYIIKSLGESIKKTKALPPYLKMFTSMPFWSLTVFHFGSIWGLYFLLTAGPKYMSEVLGFNLGHSGFLAALPYLARLLCGFIFGFIGDLIRTKNWLSVTTTRKSFSAVSHIIPGLLLLSLIMVGCDPVLSVALITMSLGLNGASTITNLQNNQDLAPNYAGTIYGIINCFGSTTGFITPAITGYLTAEHNGLHEWHIIFTIGASIYIATGIFFCMFGSGDQQEWNNVEKTNLNQGVENPAFETTTENTKV